MEHPIRISRQEKGLSLAELAAALGTSKAELSRWETGKRKVPAHRAVKVAEITGVPVHLLRPDVFPAQEAAR